MRKGMRGGTKIERKRKRETGRHTQNKEDRKRQREMEFDNNDHLLVIIVSQHTVINVY